MLGFRPGDDYKLANYDEALGYFRKLEASSKRIRLFPAGKTTRGLDWYYAVISSEANLAKLDRHKEIARQLSVVRGVNDAQARELAREGRAIVHIDSGLHSTETAPAQHAILLAHHLVSGSGPEVERILDQTILVLWFCINPDGQNQVVQWYRQNLGTPYEVAPMVELYQEYVGHDNNRDGYMQNMVESRVVTKATMEWNPVVFYDHHQVAPFPARIWIPPFAEPISDNVHPLLFRWVNVFGTSMAAYLEDRRMPGAIHRGEGFDDWYPGFIDHVNSFRNVVSFLTETALFAYATPKFYTVQDFPQDRRTLKSEVLYVSPWRGGWWRLRDAVDYCFAASMSVLNTAAIHREQLLFNKYQAGRDTIRRFTEGPPYAYVIPSEQPDPATAAVLAEKLLLNGIEVWQASAPLELHGSRFPAGSWVVPMNQPYAALVKELFEVQKYPDLRDYPGGPPDLPYDVAGWTLPLQMGVETAAIEMPLPANFLNNLQPVTKAKLAGPLVSGNGPSYTAVWSNAAVQAAHELLKAKATVAVSVAEGKMQVSGVDRGKLEGLASQLNLPFQAGQAAGAVPFQARRVGIYRSWTASIDEGWTRWLLEQYGFAPISLYDQDLRNGRLDRRIDVLILPDMRPNQLVQGFAAGQVPPRYTGGLGDAGVESIRRFVAQGGTLIKLNKSSQFAIDQLQLPVKNVLAGLKNTEFFCSGSVLGTTVNRDHPVAAGLGEQLNVMFEGGPAFELTAGDKGKVIASYAAGRTALLSGFLLGHEKLHGKAALVEVPHGKGRVVLFGFRPQWRGQSHAGYRPLFNAILQSGEWAAVPEAGKKEEKK